MWFVLRVRSDFMRMPLFKASKMAVRLGVTFSYVPFGHQRLKSAGAMHAICMYVYFSQAVNKCICKLSLNCKLIHSFGLGQNQKSILPVSWFNFQP